MRILGIETSCDETAASVVEDGKKIISNVVFSQVEIHAPFSGVVPEVASRNHLLKILEVIEEAMTGLAWQDIDAIGVTHGPGLIGALLVGLSTAKSLAYTHNLPLIPVNHIYAHMYSPHLFHEIPFPYISLVVSGGHCLIFKVEDFQNLELIGSTIDDAVGEAFDKVAKLLGLGYPGGPVIDRIAKQGDPGYLDLPRGLADTQKDRYHLSYSGLKTAVAYRVRDLGEVTVTQHKADIAASFQKAAVDMLYRKTANALQDTGISTLVVSGGVAANSYLREHFLHLEKKNIHVFTAPLEYCGDNGAMVAGRAFIDYQSGERGDLRTDAYSRLPYIKKGKRLAGHS